MATAATEKNLAGNLSSDIELKIQRLNELAKTAPPITTNPNRMSGTPLIGIERLPVSSLIDHLIEGYTVEEFIDAFDTDREKVYVILEMIKAALENGWMAQPVDY